MFVLCMFETSMLLTDDFWQLDVIVNTVNAMLPVWVSSTFVVLSSG